MAAAILKLMVLVVCLNTFLYLGVNYAIHTGPNAPDMQDDLFTILLDDRKGFTDTMDNYVGSLNSSANYTTTYKFQPAGNFSNLPGETSGSSIIPEQGGFAFLDTARMVLAFARTLWRIATMPLQLFSYNLFPPLVSVIIGFPLLLLNVITVIVFVRGGGAT